MGRKGRGSMGVRRSIRMNCDDNVIISLGRRGLYTRRFSVIELSGGELTLDVMYLYGCLCFEEDRSGGRERERERETYIANPLST